MPNLRHPIATLLPLVNEDQLYAELINCASHFRPFFLHFIVGEKIGGYIKEALWTTSPLLQFLIIFSRLMDRSLFWDSIYLLVLQCIDDRSSFWFSNHAVQL